MWDSATKEGEMKWGKNEMKNKKYTKLKIDRGCMQDFSFVSFPLNRSCCEWYFLWKFLQTHTPKSNMSLVRCVSEVGNSPMKRYISAKARENSKHVKPKLLSMDFFDSKCFQYGVNHCKTTFISCLCLSKEGWDTKLSRLVCSVQDSVQRGRCAHLRQGKAILKQLVVTLKGIVVWQPKGYWIRH